MIEKLNIVVKDNREYINTTPHVIKLINEKGETFEVPPCGFLLNATTQEESHGIHEGYIELCKTKFIPNDEGLKFIESVYESYRLKRKYSTSIIPIIIGSIIAAQAYPNDVYAMIPHPDFVRVPIDQKKMLSYKFTIF